MKPSPVTHRREAICLPTYEPQAPEKNPMFLETRVYQGSSGKVYPLPFCDRIAEHPVPREWDAVILENEFLEVMILPELGGRIHTVKDRTNGYDLFYRQDVIKPALVGLAGPWISGGVEFNWPQHHRPATFMPTEVEIEHSLDGSITVWCSDHDPLQRMKGMHGICLHPGKSIVEIKVRAYNRTPLVQTFLWWANAAAQVHENYQSFFPPDVFHVADHARRSISTYPLCQGSYYGVDYAAQARDGGSNDLSFYANIPVPTSYMCMGTKEDFFGGYDHHAQAGVVHVANHHIAPGKKQWTWGNHEFGKAWDRCLTDPDAVGNYPPYIELMAGVYTDNQPDFAFLNPGETKTWSQFWFPIRETGKPRHAETTGAVGLTAIGQSLRVAVSVTERHHQARILLKQNTRILAKIICDLAPDSPLVRTLPLPSNTCADAISLTVIDSDGRTILSCRALTDAKGEAPPVATEPPAPSQISSMDELYITGLHLDQYRHATRSPEPYWREAIARDPGDSRCNTAIGIRHLKRGEFHLAATHLRQSVKRLTLRNGNPADGEAYYHLGLTLRHLGRDEEAYAAFYKAAWNQAWQSAAYHALAEMDCRSGAFEKAISHLDLSLRMNTDNLRARNLRAMVMQQLGLDPSSLLAETLLLDPLDSWCRFLLDEPLRCDTQTHLDLSLDLIQAGFFREAESLLTRAVPGPGDAPMLSYYLAWIYELTGHAKKAQQARNKALAACPDYCFPCRLEEIAILESAILANPSDPRAPYYLGNLFYDRRRHKDAIQLWEASAQLDPSFSVVWRNLGLGYYNICNSPKRANKAYERAFRAAPCDARLLYERDQLWKRTAVSPARRLRELRKYPNLVSLRDDLTVEICILLNLTGMFCEALQILENRKFQPWEGGEGMALGQYIQTHLNLGCTALGNEDATTAVYHFQMALDPPRNLGEAKHPLANQSEVHYWLGQAYHVLKRNKEAKSHWKLAADFRGDFQDMSTRAFSEMTYFSALAMRSLGRNAAAENLLKGLLKYSKDLARKEPKIDFFATSLPTMLLFAEDLHERQSETAMALEALARKGLTLQDPRLARQPNRSSPRHDPSSRNRHERIRRS